MKRHAAATILVLSCATVVSAQPISNRGFVDAQFALYPQEAPNDTTRGIGDLLIRDEVTFRPAEWLELSAGADFRANSHDQVEDDWRLDWSDRSLQRPRLSLRRATATITRGPFTIDIGKQFIRWARADVLNPQDRFAPKDYLAVVNNEVLPVLGIRPSIQLGREIIEGVWVGQPTPSRLPLITQRWAILPAELAGLPLIDRGNDLPERSQEGLRWRHVGDRLETGLSFFNGVNHLPDINGEILAGPAGPVGVELQRHYPDIRAYGADFAIPTSVLTLKGEASYVNSRSDTSDEYVLYVIELERQIGNWILDGGYAGEVVTEEREEFAFNPERGLAKSIVGHLGYTGDPERTFVIEGAVRQNGDGLYLKGEYSQAFGQHLRFTVTGIGIGGDDDDFLGQFHHNSSITLGARLSF